ncbi:hypothetical protein [Algibacter mikhailovii]|uniref:Beta-hexosaminidase bacterial type N-terminal domain-containing protein n=1 Tax=Algibacter mikhailovii TaxID=425498 RepID=A0A918VCG0_9FLAO|nr:hypothetical protein [Algibacter mikhailovii]GGZ88069.1 hypothetical protein GCM10007028_27980 [Algibacter mikhailovii]
MNFKNLVLIAVSFFVFSVSAQSRGVFLSSYSDVTKIALEKLADQTTFSKFNIESVKKSKSIDSKIILLKIEADNKWIKKFKLKPNTVKSEGFQIINKVNNTYLIASDDSGLMYGILELRDQLKLNGNNSKFIEKTENPHFPFRAVKFNLPWSSYRIGESLHLHMKTVKDISFWEGYLDMMAENRLNALTLWNLHPFTFMVQSEKFPEATQFTGQEFKDWQKFWRQLFKMAKDRNIETYIVNWNIITSPGITETHNVANYKDDLEWHYGFTPADTSQVIVDYMRETITQTINEYPNLTGLGVSIGERMKMPMEDAMKWVKNTFIEGMKNADRKVKFIHRAPFKVEPEIAREYIESYTDFPDPIIMEFKFNWSHGHSTPNLAITHGGKVSDQYWNPKPSNYKMAWMMRNEDFIMLNWGNTEFIREHIAVNDIPDVTAGYFIGSETYIPAKEFRMNPDVNYNWKYAYEKDWEFYQMWGRLMYDPNTSDDYFIKNFNYRYGNEVGESLFRALQLGSKMPLRFSTFYKGTWDFTIYSEGFLNGKQLYRNYKEAEDAFIRIDEMITHKTLDPLYLNIDEYNNLKLARKSISNEYVTPLELANEMERNGLKILELCHKMEGSSINNAENFNIEINDVKAWAHLSLYFADKLMAGINLDEGVKTKSLEKKQKAIDYLRQGSKHWLDLIDSTKQYQEVSLLHIRSFKFSWEMYYPRVLKDIEIVESINF